MSITPENIEQFREQLKDQHRKDLVANLRNEDDPTEEAQSLISVISQALGRLIDIEQDITLEMVKDPDGCCPGCLMSQTRDLVKLQDMGSIFNSYLEGGGCERENE